MVGGVLLFKEREREKEEKWKLKLEETLLFELPCRRDNFYYLADPRAEHFYAGLDGMGRI